MSPKLIEKISSFWPFFGLCSAAFAFLNPYIGYYALDSLAVLLIALWVANSVSARFKRNNENRELLGKMNKKQKEAYAKADLTEEKSQTSLTTALIPAVTIACMAINGYTWYYNSSRNILCSFITNELFAQPSFLGFMMFLSVLFGLMFLIGFVRSMKRMLAQSALA